MISQKDKDAGHQFRGEFLNLCAIVENWTIEILNNDSVKKLRNDKKPPMLFGQKLAEIGKLTKTNPELFRNSDRVVLLMEKFSSYASLRSDLAHSTMDFFEINKEICFGFTNAGQYITPDISKRIWFNESDRTTISRKLKQLVKQLQDQKVKT